MGNKSEFDMKKLLTYLFVFLLATGFMYAQESIGRAKFWARYKFSYKTDPKQQNFIGVDWMFLDIGDKITKFYSRYDEIKDSMMSEGLKKGLSAWDLHESTKQYFVQPGTAVYYQLYDQKKTRVTAKFMPNGYVYEEPMKMPEWKLENKSLMLYGYQCRRAMTHYCGRDWEVYYAPELPFSYGPWKLWGLPGLIVRATDSDHHFLFEIDLFQKLKNESPIIYIHRLLGNRGGYKGKEYNKVSKKTFLEYEELFHKDFIGFSDFITGDQTTTFDESGNRIANDARPIPYIPIER